MSVRALLAAALIAVPFGLAAPSDAAPKGVVYDLFTNTAVTYPGAQDTTWAPGTTRILTVTAYDVDRKLVAGTQIAFAGVDDRGRTIATATVTTDSTGTARISRTFWQNETWHAAAVDAAVGWATYRSLGRYVVIPGTTTLPARATVNARAKGVSLSTTSARKVVARLQKKSGSTWTTVGRTTTSKKSRTLPVTKSGAYRVVLDVGRSSYPVLSWTKS